MNFDAVKEVLIAEADRAGLREYEVYFMESSSVSAETLKDEISSFSSGVSGGVSFRCILNGHLGSASTELLTKEEMKELVARAMTNATVVENHDPVMLYRGSDRYETVSLPAGIADAATVKEVALTLQAKTYEGSELVTDGTQSGVFSEALHMELMNSRGLRLSNQGSVSGVYVQAVIQKDEEAQDAFDFRLGLAEEAWTDLPSETVKEAISKVGATEVESGKYDLIISGKQMRALLSAYDAVFSAKQAQLGLSLLKGREGESIAAEKVTLIDDPMRADCPMKAPFDGEGVATYRKSVIERGVLKTLLYDLTTAEKAGKKPTGNGQRVSYSDPVSIRPYSFYLQAGDRNEKELLETLKEGLYVTEFKGLHAGANAVTGDFSLESAGYRVKDGRICEAVKSFTVAGNFFDLLKKIEALSNQVHFGIPSGFSVFGSPNVLVRDMSVAGK